MASTAHFIDKISGRIMRLVFKNEKPVWIDPDDNESTLETPIFGTNFKQSTRMDVVTNNSTIHLLYTSINYTTLVSGLYRIGVNAGWNLDTVQRNIVIELEANGTPMGSLVMEPSDAGAEIQNWNSGFFYYQHSGGALDIEMHFSPETSGDVAKIFYGGLECWRAE